MSNDVYRSFIWYQNNARRTLNLDAKLEMAALGLMGEAGEVAEIIKKYRFHGHKLDIENFIKELGDVLWYIAALCTMFGVPLSEVAEANIEKLKERYPEGFSHEASINRKEK